MSKNIAKENFEPRRQDDSDIAEILSWFESKMKYETSGSVAPAVAEPPADLHPSVSSLSLEQQSQKFNNLNSILYQSFKNAPAQDKDYQEKKEKWKRLQAYLRTQDPWMSIPEQNSYTPTRRGLVSATQSIRESYIGENLLDSKTTLSGIGMSASSLSSYSTNSLTSDGPTSNMPDHTTPNSSVCSGHGDLDSRQINTPLIYDRPSLAFDRMPFPTNKGEFCLSGDYRGEQSYLQGIPENRSVKSMVNESRISGTGTNPSILRTPHSTSPCRSSGDDSDGSMSKKLKDLIKEALLDLAGQYKEPKETDDQKSEDTAQHITGKYTAPSIYTEPRISNKLESISIDDVINGLPSLPIELPSAINTKIDDRCATSKTTFNENGKRKREDSPDLDTTYISEYLPRSRKLKLERSQRGVTNAYDSPVSVAEMDLNMSEELFAQQIEDHRALKCRDIRYPLAMMQKIRKYARVLALVCSDSPEYCIEILNKCSVLNRLFFFSSTMAWYYLSELNFFGPVFSVFSCHHDPLRVNFRSYYLHRTAERNNLLLTLKSHWLNRLYEKAGMPRGKFGLYFNGIDITRVLCETEAWNVALACWIRLFAKRIKKDFFKQKPSEWKSLIADSKMSTIIDVQREAGEIWVVLFSDGFALYVVSSTGMVIGVRYLNRKRILFSSFDTQYNSKYEFGSVKDVRFLNPTVQADWMSYIFVNRSSQQVEDMRVGKPFPRYKDLLCYVYPINKELESKQYIRGIPAKYYKSENHNLLVLCKRFILSHTTSHRISPHRRHEGTAYDLSSDFVIREAFLPRQKVRIGRRVITLDDNIAFIKTNLCGWFVIPETGQEIGQDDAMGIPEFWTNFLNANKWGETH
ncbi:hypothetical protein V1511DRAFT_501879 [Dipodascopsis uninucleata]